MEQDMGHEINHGLKCENEYCIYNNDGECLFERVTINQIGMCDDCIMITLDKNFLAKEKGRQLSEIESRHKKDYK